VKFNIICALATVHLFLMSCVGETISPGVYYKHIIQTGTTAQSMHILVVDPNHANIVLQPASDEFGILKPVLQICKDTHALAGINAGYFGWKKKNIFFSAVESVAVDLGITRRDAYPVFALKIDENWHSLSNVFTGVISWNRNDQQPLFDAVKTTLSLQINNQYYQVNDLNKSDSCENVLFSPAYKDALLTTKKYVYIVIDQNRVKDIVADTKKYLAMPKNGFVYAIKKDTFVADKKVKIGDPVSVSVICESKFGSDASEICTSDFLLGSMPFLVNNGEIVPYVYDYTGHFYKNRHPRTAVGILKNGFWVFFVVDGRQKSSLGFTILELALFMKQLGCIHAMNLDGGGSSTMVIHDKVVNSPSDTFFGVMQKERLVANALLIFPK